MTREEAVRSFTIWNARSIGREADQSSLEPGKRADLVALSDDVFTCAEETIVGITPSLVMVDGEIVRGA
jgi:predicted amidohydrolase YtcJ